MKVFYQILALLVLLFINVLSVEVHDAGGGYGTEESWISRFGHYSNVLTEDLIVAALLIVVAGISLYLHYRGLEDKPPVNSINGIRKIQAFLMLVVLIIISFEWFAELQILSAENQQLLTGTAKFFRVVACLDTAIIGMWSFGLAIGFWLYANPD